MLYLPVCPTGRRRRSCHLLHRSKAHPLDAFDGDHVTCRKVLAKARERSRRRRLSHAAAAAAQVSTVLQHCATSWSIQLLVLGTAWHAHRACNCMPRFLRAPSLAPGIQAELNPVPRKLAAAKLRCPAARMDALPGVLPAEGFLLCCRVPLQEYKLQTAAAAAAATASPIKTEAEAPQVSAARQAAMPLVELCSAGTAAAPRPARTTRLPSKLARMSKAIQPG